MALKAELTKKVIARLRPTIWKPDTSAAAKEELLHSFLFVPQSKIPRPFHPFLPLLKALGKLVFDGHETSMSLHAKQEFYTKEQARACIVSYINAIDKNLVAEENWSYVDADPPKPVVPSMFGDGQFCIPPK
jgi:hypothetical protein